MESFVDYLAAGSYWVLIALWACLLIFCAYRLSAMRARNQLVIILLVVLLIDAARTIIENLPQGMWYASEFGLVSAAIGEFFNEPNVLVLAKVLSALAAMAIVLILFSQWPPNEKREQKLHKDRSAGVKEQVEARTRALNEQVAKLEQQLNRQQSLMDEVDHGVKNNLASMISVVQFSLTATHDPQAAQASLINRMYALSRAHDALADAKWGSVRMRTIVERTIKAHVRGNLSISIDTSPVLLAPDAVAPFGLIVDELATNAARHGSLSRSNGSLEVNWKHLDDGAVVLKWREKHPHPISATGEDGLGLRLCRDLASNDLGGAFSIQFNDTGIDAALTIPAARLRAT